MIIIFGAEWLAIFFIVACLGVNIIIDDISNNINYIMVGIIVGISLYVMYKYIIYQKEEENKLAFWMGITELLTFMPLWFFLFESFAIDYETSKYLCCNLLKGTYEEVQIIIIYFTIILLIVFLIPQLLSSICAYLNKKRKTNIISIIPLILGIISIIVVANITVHSYNDYHTMNNKECELSENQVVSDAQLYIPSELSGTNIWTYPVLSPIKITNGKIPKGENIFVINKEHDATYYESYLFVKYKDKFGYINRELLSEKIKWRGDKSK